MRNRYKGVCYKCGLPVDPGTGHFERHKGVWRTRHALYPDHGAVTCEMALKAKREAGYRQAQLDIQAALGVAK